MQFIFFVFKLCDNISFVAFIIDDLQLDNVLAQHVLVVHDRQISKIDDRAK